MVTLMNYIYSVFIGVLNEARRTMRVLLFNSFNVILKDFNCKISLSQLFQGVGWLGAFF